VVNAGQNLPPQTVKQKFVDASEDSFDYSSVFIPARSRAIQGRPTRHLNLHQGAAGYARYFWHAAWGAIGCHLPCFIGQVMQVHS
jgi:hypothetical protein